jgi:hypothetical protein
MKYLRKAFENMGSDASTVEPVEPESTLEYNPDVDASPEAFEKEEEEHFEYKDELKELADELETATEMYDNFSDIRAVASMIRNPTPTQTKLLRLNIASISGSVGVARESLVPQLSLEDNRQSWRTSFEWFETKGEGILAKLVEVVKKIIRFFVEMWQKFKDSPDRLAKKLDELKKRAQLKVSGQPEEDKVTISIPPSYLFMPGQREEGLEFNKYFSNIQDTIKKSFVFKDIVENTAKRLQADTKKITTKDLSDYKFGAEIIGFLPGLNNDISRISESKMKENGEVDSTIFNIPILGGLTVHWKLPVIESSEDFENVTDIKVYTTADSVNAQSSTFSLYSQSDIAKLIEFSSRMIGDLKKTTDTMNQISKNISDFNKQLDFISAFMDYKASGTNAPKGIKNVAGIVKTASAIIKMILVGSEVVNTGFMNSIRGSMFMIDKNLRVYEKFAQEASK